MKKKLLILLAITLVVILPVVSGCGRTAPTGVTTVPGPKVPHVVDVRFENCNACHVADQLSATKPLPHTGMGYTNKDCISAACHALTIGATTPPPTSTTPPTSPTGTGTGTTTATSQPAKTLTDVALPNTTHNLAALAAYKTVGCLFCHGPNGSNPQPYAPSWNATASNSVHNSGTFVVVPGSPADHTGYTNDTDCEKAGCHAMPTS